MQGPASDSCSGAESENLHKRLMNRLDRAEAELNSEAHVDGGIFLDSLLGRYDA